MRHPTLFLVVLFACGGKIAPDPSGQATPAPASTPTREVPATVPTGISVDEACETVCDRNARCGAGYKPDCLDRCRADATSRCASSAIAFTTCWARTTDEGCGELAPECEPAYCAYTRCTGIASPPYCE